MRICVFYSALVVFHFKIYHIVAFKDLSNRHTFPLKFFQKKKKKALSSSGGFQKSKFFFKNTTILIRPLEVGICCLVKKLFWKRMGGGDFLKNPQGLNLLFCKPGTYLCSLFFILFFAFGAGFSFGSRIFCFGVGVALQGFQILGLDKKQKSIINSFVRNRNLKLLLHCLIFWGA